MSESSQASHSLDDVRRDAELHGLTDALENLTSSVENSFRSELESFEKKWAAIESVKATEEVFSVRCIEFLEKLGRFRHKKDQANEISVSLCHPSFQTDFSNILRRAELAGSIRQFPASTVGKMLVDLILALYLLESKWVDDKSVGAFSNATRYLGSYALTEKFWVDQDLGSPLVGRGFTDQKGLLDKAYKKLVHAIFLYEGFFAAKDFVIASLEPAKFLNTFAEEIEFGDAKTLLQEYYQELGLKPPTYQYTKDPQSPDHDPTFEVSLQLQRFGRLQVDAKSKKEGSKKLAEKAIISIRRDKQSRSTLMQLLAKKSSSTQQERRPISAQSIPDEIFDLEKKLESEFGLEADYFRLMQALKTKSFGRSRYENLPDNDIISLIGSSILDFAIISSDSEFRSLGIEGVHPRICDALATDFQLKSTSRAIYHPLHDWGVNVDRQMAQALIFALFINDQSAFFGSMLKWIRSHQTFTESVSAAGGERALPKAFDEKFSYVTVLQEFVQQASPSLPKYSKITKGPTHAATHVAICEYEGNSTSGSSTRFVWARNAAAFEMLKKLGFFEGRN